MTSETAHTFLPGAGDEAFVLAGDGGVRRILFKTTVEEVFHPEGREPFVVTVEGLRFLPRDGDLVTIDRGRELTLLPATQSTVDQVRAAGRARAQHRRAVREKRTVLQVQLDTICQQLRATERNLSELRIHEKSSRSAVEQARLRLIRLERDLAHRTAQLEKKGAVYQTRLEKLRAEIAELDAKQQDGRAES